MRDVRGAASVEAIMNSGSATGFLPNFVRFPSLRGLHSSTVQPWQVRGRTRGAGAPAGDCLPTGAGPDAVPPRNSAAPSQLPGSVASPASAPARRPSAARGVPPAGVTPTRVVTPSRVTPSRVMAAAGRARTGAALRPGPPAGAPAARAAPDRPRAPASVRLGVPVAAGPAAPRRHGGHAQHRDHRQDDARNHGVLPPIPGARRPRPSPFPGRRRTLPGRSPKQPPVGASQRAREMPCHRSGQSTLEELQSLDGGWPA